MLNLTLIPEAFAEILGVSTDASGIILSVAITSAFLLAISLLIDFNTMPVVIIGVDLFSMFTFLGWFPIWTMILIAMLTAILYAKEITAYISGNRGS